MYRCKKCGHVSQEKIGRCPTCRSFDIEASKEGESDLTPLNLVEMVEGETFSSGLKEFDLVSNQLHRGSLVVLAGPPGCGKSTCALKISANVADQGRKVFYFAGEESKYQARKRAQRIGAESGNIQISRDLDLNNMLAVIDKHRPDLVIIDSMQKITSKEGELNIVKLAADRFLNLCKALQNVIIMIGQVSKDDRMAGPRIVEHTVDVYLRIDKDHRNLRILSAEKNRLGSDEEIGVLEMTEKGLVSYNPEEAYTKKEQRRGSALGMLRFGKRFMVCEVQCRQSGKKGRVVADGLNSRRVEMIAAVLEDLAEIEFEKGLMVKLALGLKGDDTSLDLCVAAALLSTYYKRPPPAGNVFAGEISLTGEVLVLADLEQRQRATERMIGPKGELVSAENCEFIELLPKSRFV